jgi:hypothetical protein
MPGRNVGHGGYAAEYVSAGITQSTSAQGEKIRKSWPKRLQGLALSGKADTRLLKGDARTAKQKAKKQRKSAKRGLALSGKVDPRFLKGDARTAKQKALTERQRKTIRTRVYKQKAGPRRVYKQKAKSLQSSDTRA